MINVDDKLIWLCCTGLNSTITSNNSTRSCPEGMIECLFERVVGLDYMVYFNFFGCVLVPLIVMLVIYAHIFMAARRQLRLMTLKVAHTPAPREINSRSSSSRTTLQKEVQAAKPLAIIVGLFALCWLPLHLLNCFNHFCTNCERPHIWVMYIAIILSHTNSVVNPFIYAYRIREFRLTFRRILYQQMLGQRDGHGFRVRNNDGRDVRSSSITPSSSHTSREGSSCVTIVNNYIPDSSLDRTLPKAACEGSSHWASPSDAAPSSYIPNGNQIKGSTISATQQQPCITGFSVRDGAESVTYLGETTDVLEVRDSGSCISFVNIQALSPKQTGPRCCTELPEVSWQNNTEIYPCLHKKIRKCDNMRMDLCPLFEIKQKFLVYK